MTEHQATETTPEEIRVILNLETVVRVMLKGKAPLHPKRELIRASTAPFLNGLSEIQMRFEMIGRERTKFELTQVSRSKLLTTTMVRVTMLRETSKPKLFGNH
jgi:hypothetical protein